MTTFSHSSHMDHDPWEVFAFHLDAANLRAITPPFPPFTLLEAPETAEPGATHVFRLGYGRAGVTWHARLTRVEREPGPGRPYLLEDVQDRGPFREWRHQHQVYGVEGGAMLRDVVRFRLFPGPVGRVFDRLLVTPGLKALFVYRHWRTKRLLTGRVRGG